VDQSWTLYNAKCRKGMWVKKSFLKEEIGVQSHSYESTAYSHNCERATLTRGNT
jgi:hypothetical protein